MKNQNNEELKKKWCRIKKKDGQLREIIKN